MRKTVLALMLVLALAGLITPWTTAEAALPCDKAILDACKEDCRHIFNDPLTITSCQMGCLIGCVISGNT